MSSAAAAATGANGGPRAGACAAFCSAACCGATQRSSLGVARSTPQPRHVHALVTQASCLADRPIAARLAILPPLPIPPISRNRQGRQQRSTSRRKLPHTACPSPRPVSTRNPPSTGQSALVRPPGSSRPRLPTLPAQVSSTYLSLPHNPSTDSGTQARASKIFVHLIDQSIFIFPQKRNTRPRNVFVGGSGKVHQQWDPHTQHLWRFHHKKCQRGFTDRVGDEGFDICCAW